MAEDDASRHSFKPLLDNSWIPPQIFLDRASGDAWVLVQGSSFAALDSWTVYAQKTDGFAVRCTVRFMPVSGAAKLLPPPVRRFAAILTNLLGPGTDEGTLHPTARIAAAANSDWANILYRPWALNNRPYNSRAEVDSNLEKWAAVNAKRRAVYNEMLHQYPLAQRALATYYEQHFNAAPVQAIAMARYATDLVFRDYFVFSSTVNLANRLNAERVAKAQSTSPWPAPVQQ